MFICFSSEKQSINTDFIINFCCKIERVSESDSEDRLNYSILFYDSVWVYEGRIKGTLPMHIHYAESEEEMHRIYNDILRGLQNNCSVIYI